jgi:phosphoglycolate phosphatase-like HAD superfamily hydrolase
VLRTLEDLGIAAENTLVIGDMPFDILMGKNAGAFTCGVTYGNADRKSLEEAGADYIVDSIEEILKI